MSIRIPTVAVSLVAAGLLGTAAASHAEDRRSGAGLVQLVQFGTGWTQCAEENGFCVVPYPTVVRYGTGGRYHALQVTGGVYCGNVVFGDPYVGARKHCDFQSAGFAAPTPAQRARYCASEGEFCSFTGTAQVIYRAGDRAASGVFFNGAYCGNQVFGDPAVGARKSCYVVQ
jgi:hypothetical protein